MAQDFPLPSPFLPRIRRALRRAMGVSWWMDVESLQAWSIILGSPNAPRSISGTLAGFLVGAHVGLPVLERLQHLLGGLKQSDLLELDLL